MANKHMKTYSTVLADREMQIETTMRYHFAHPFKVAIFEKKKKNNPRK